MVETLTSRQPGRIVRRVAKCLVAGSCLALVTMASSMQTGKTPQGRAYTTGGISAGELSAMYAGRAQYNLWVVTAALGSGAHLADAHVVIRDAKGQAVFDGRLHGPWLFIELPLGRYEVEARVGKESHKRVTTLHAGDHHQSFFYFATGDDVSPEYRSPFPGSPYAGKAP